MKLDPKTDRPLRESNTKLVQWEDGSLTMFVGKEALNLTRQKLANSFLFVNEVRCEVYFGLAVLIPIRRANSY